MAKNVMSEERKAQVAAAYWESEDSESRQDEFIAGAAFADANPAPAKEAEQAAKTWWTNYPGDPEVNPGVGDSYLAWRRSHIRAFIAGDSNGALRERERIKKIICRDVNGEEIWEFYEKDILKGGAQ